MILRIPNLLDERADRAQVLDVLTLLAQGEPGLSLFQDRVNPPAPIGRVIRHVFESVDS